VVDLMPEQRAIEDKGATMRLGADKINLQSGTIAHHLYGKKMIVERHRHRYEANGEYLDRLQEAGLIFSGKSLDGLRMEILELKDNRFHFATQFHGEFKSRPNRPSPPYVGFIAASLKKALELS
jgi:CTP synthase